MKKLLCLILSAVLLALTGCGSAEPPAAETPAETAAPAGTAVPEVSPSPAEEATGPGIEPSTKEDET